jgi:TPR repeat protein
MAKNDSETYFRLCQYYQHGLYGLPQDEEKVFELCNKAADLGLIEAHQFLGNCYWFGKGTPKDANKAKHHWEISAMKGDNQSGKAFVGYVRRAERRSSACLPPFNHCSKMWK